MTPDLPPLKNPAELTIVWRFMLSPTNKEYQTWGDPAHPQSDKHQRLAQKYPCIYTPKLK